DDHSGPVAVVLGLGHAHRLLEVLVGRLQVDDLVTLLRQESRLYPARNRLPAVQEEDFHGVVVACCACQWENTCRGLSGRPALLPDDQEQHRRAAVAKKNQKESKAWTPARFAAGVQVRVKPGITVPSFEDIPLGGWAGTIREVDQRSA